MILEHLKNNPTLLYNNYANPQKIYYIKSRFTISSFSWIYYSAWMKEFIEFNTKKRMQANNTLNRIFFKLVINADYGKTVERDRKKRDIKLVNSWNINRKYISKSEFKSLTIYAEIVFNKPIYMGFTILELSQNLLYDFF